MREVLEHPGGGNVGEAQPQMGRAGLPGLPGLGWRVALAVLLLLAVPPPGHAVTVVDQARALVARYHEDRTRLDQARDLLEAALRQERVLETMLAASRVYFTYGDVRAASVDDKLAAYDRGREIARRAIELWPRSVEAHLLFAIHTGRWGQTKGLLRSLFLVPTLREELDLIFSLDPNIPAAHALAGNVFLELPAMLGGDRAKAEEHFKRGLQLDPRFTPIRVDLARLYIASGRITEARQELQRVLDERAPRNLADWTVKDIPRARALLESIRDRK